MQTYIIQHVDFEGPGTIAEWLELRGATARTILALTEQYPPAVDVDLLVVMGGPMSVTDRVRNPWLDAESCFVRDVLDAGGRVVGVCLGAQILAEALGGRVYRNAGPEIGWFPLAKRPAATGTALDVLADGMVVGHWHGDTFDPPAGAVVTHSTSATPHQAFVSADGRALGLQFHLEWDDEALGKLVDRCRDELVAGPTVESDMDMLLGLEENGQACRKALFALLDRFYPG